MPKRGRPSAYSEELAQEICDRLAAGESLRSICSSPHMPAENRIREWAQNDCADNAGLGAGFSARYTRARAIGCERLAEELLLISDDPCLGPDGYVDNGAVQRARLMSDNRRWLLSKLLPRQYGDRITQELTTGEDGGAITMIQLIPIDPRPRGQLEADEAAAIPLRAITSR